MLWCPKEACVIKLLPNSDMYVLDVQRFFPVIVLPGLIVVFFPLVLYTHFLSLFFLVLIFSIHIHSVNPLFNDSRKLPRKPAIDIDMVLNQTSHLKPGHWVRVILIGILFSVLCVITWRHNSNGIAVIRRDNQDGATAESIGFHSSQSGYWRHASRHHHNHDSYGRASSLGTHKNSTLTRRDYLCSASNPCSNGACCGATGVCGYGPTYCGAGCISQCDAKAECGKYAQNPGQTCPLNTCCSEFGFVSDNTV